MPQELPNFQNLKPVEAASPLCKWIFMLLTTNCVLVQPTVIDEVRTGTYRQLFHPGVLSPATACLQVRCCAYVTGCYVNVLNR